MPMQLIPQDPSLPPVPLAEIWPVPFCECAQPVPEPSPAGVYCAWCERELPPPLEAA
jgi:hypothetical protein